MADSIRTLALATEQEFPFVTVPDFAVSGSNMRVQADAVLAEWAPLVTDDQRLEWEKYALANRNHIVEAYNEDETLRDRQNKKFGLLALNATFPPPPPRANVTVLDDESFFHPKIWSNGGITPKGDEKEGTGPYLPIWQRRYLLFLLQHYLVTCSSSHSKRYCSFSQSDKSIWTGPFKFQRCHWKDV